MYSQLDFDSKRKAIFLIKNHIFDIYNYKADISLQQGPRLKVIIQVKAMKKPIFKFDELIWGTYAVCIYL